MFAEPSTTVLGGSEVFVGQGSTINLTCVIRLSPEPPNSIRWQHNNQVNNTAKVPRVYPERFLRDRRAEPIIFSIDRTAKCFLLKKE